MKKISYPEIYHDLRFFENIWSVRPDAGRFPSTVSDPPLAIGDIAVERIGGLSHTAQKVSHIVRCDAIPKMLRHPDRHIIVREIISKKLFQAVNVLNVPNGVTRHPKKD
jgi:hypothetical protein